MPLFGTLKTMPLTDVLQWLGTSRRTGTLQVEHRRVGKSILFRDGRIVGCSSDDPPQRLGQFLIARGRINEDQLREALAEQERKARHLGRILVDMGAIVADELSEHLEAKAEETILSMFDWPEAVFRFLDGLCDEANMLPISLRVEDVLLRGVKRLDEMRRIRQVLHEPGIVLKRTGAKPSEELLADDMARALFESIDGERSLADIRLHVHGSEYVVDSMLFELHSEGLVEIARVRSRTETAEGEAGEARPEDPDLATLLPELEEPSDADRPEREERPAAATAAARAAVGALAAAPPTETAGPAPPATEVSTAGAPAAAEPLKQRLQEARQAMDGGNFETALDIFEALYRDFPGDESLRRLALEAELAFVEKAYRHYLPPYKVLRLNRPTEELTAEQVSPREFFLLSRIDGTWDVKSIIQIAPLREVDTLRALKRLRETGVIDLHDPPR